MTDHQGPAGPPPPSRRGAASRAKFGVIRPGGATPHAGATAWPPAGPTPGPGAWPPGPPTTGFGSPQPPAAPVEPLVPVVSSGRTRDAAPQAVPGGPTSGPGSFGPGSFGPAPGPGAWPAPPGPPVGASPGMGMAGTANGGASGANNTIVAGAIAGAVGGILGFLLTRLQGESLRSMTEAEMRVHSAVWTMLFGIGLGAVLASWRAMTTQAWPAAARRAGLGALIGAAAGFPSGYVAQHLFATMLKDATYENYDSKMLLARVLGWAVFGAGIGLGISLLYGPRRIVNGLLGGAIGGAIGGFVFQKISDDATSSTGPQFWGLLSIAVGIGLAIGVFDRIFRQFWLQGTVGPFRGHEIILFKPRTTIGSGPSCDLVIANDPAAAPVHATVAVHGNDLIVEPLAPVAVDGVPVTGPSRVRAGQRVQLGRSEFLVGHRSPTAGPPG